MKKIYLEPETVVYKVNVRSHLMEASMTGGDSGTVNFSDNPVDETDPETFELAGREDNNDRNSVWDNIW